MTGTDTDNRIRASIYPVKTVLQRLVTSHDPDAILSQPSPSTAVIQIEDPTSLEAIVNALVREEYTFEVHQSFEIAPLIHVYGQVNPDL